MSKFEHKTIHYNAPLRPDEHKTIQSYIVGFLLSLVFTAIPYYMVVNQSLTGSSLLITILIFGFLQMLVQIFFFLHLGRGPKPLYNVVFFASTVGIILIVAGGSIVIMSNLHRNKTIADQTKSLVDREGIYQIHGEHTGACFGQHTNHQIIIEGGQLLPENISAQKCDTLTFINKDNNSYEFMFGTNSEKRSYAGESKYFVRSGKNKTITLSEVGTYRFYDYIQPDTAGNLTVFD